jgi:uncharacterized membrane protein YfcA
MEIILISLLTLVAGMMGTIGGFGTSTIMVPIALLFLPLPETLLLVGIIHWFGDLWKMYFFKKGIDWQLIISFGIPGIIAAFLGASLVLQLPGKLASQFVGLILIAYILFLLLKPTFKIKRSVIAAGVGGAGSGFLGGLTGVGGGALRAVVLTAFNIPKSTYIFTSGLLGAVIDASRISTYLISGVSIRSQLTFGLIFFIPASFFGAMLAKRIVDKIPERKFRNIIAVFLFLLGVKLTFFP